jgi:alpha-mannosidase
VRDHLASLEPHADRLPVWRDELYLELHRGCATSRPDQKRHNRTLERLLREVETVAALGGCSGTADEIVDWRPLLFQQFHDILPGTSIPEVFDQAEAVWRSARRKAVYQRDHQLRQLCVGTADPSGCRDTWLWFGLQPLARWSPLLRLPAGEWSAVDMALPRQIRPNGGVWVQLPLQRGISSVVLNRSDEASVEVAPIRAPVKLQRLDGHGWRFSNEWLEVDCGSGGLLQLRDSQGVDQLAGPLQPARFQDRGEFWDAWDLAGDYRSHPLAVEVSGPCQLLEHGPLVVHAVQRYQLGSSVMRLDMRLQADCPWLELICSIDWRQRHELLRLELPLASTAVRYAADSAGTVLERPAMAYTSREHSRWEVPLISWLASQANAPGGGLAVLLDGPQGVDVVPERIGVSLLRGPTWPDPGADRGWHRQRLALMPVTGSWSRAGVPQAAIAFREPGWSGPLDGHPTSRRWFPPLAGELVPVALRMEADGLGLRCLNPGPSRCRWQPRQGWLVTRQGGQPVQAIELQPGELADLRLVQSS